MLKLNNTILSLFCFLAIFSSVISLTNAANFMEICNLNGASWLAISSQPCSNNITLVIPPASRVQITGGPYSSGCGATYYTVYTFDSNAGYVDSRYLCQIKSVFRGGDRVVPCRLPSGWNYLSVFSGPYTYTKPIGVFDARTSGLVVSDPVYNAQGLYLSKVLVGNVIGYVDSNYLCLN
ncbi:hypothetical protein ABK040_007668 [Willaertia magna]